MPEVGAHSRYAGKMRNKSPLVMPEACPRSLLSGGAGVTVRVPWAWRWTGFGVRHLYFVLQSAFV